MTAVYVLTDGDDLYDDDSVIGVFSSLKKAQSYVSGVEWVAQVGLIGDFYFAVTYEDDVHRYFTIYPYTLGPDDLELA
jgi:hypothetical protein